MSHEEVIIDEPALGRFFVFVDSARNHILDGNIGSGVPLPLMGPDSYIHKGFTRWR